ncbi:MAG: hypothetical protein EOQ60_32175 [Mesorhizobium sp.]|nr:hypothetical protein EOA91_31335 [Mesorhizobium sp. M1A.F.Ca.IN.022.04.1.1]RWG24565.1 MAG: hypothetical protein EOQ60_32175 [Mesorhizobium sp.]TIS18153.1 MAG: hypothetical protein E5X10_00605 [Mesorhizobium sp.]
MRKGAKQAIQRPPLDRDLALEANYYVRKCGLTRDETVRIIRQASASKAIVSRRDHPKGS